MENQDELLTVGSAASVLWVSTDTIKRWEKKGLIKSRRSDKNFRVFSLDEMRRLQNKIWVTSWEHRFSVFRVSERTPYTCIDLFAWAGWTALWFENAWINHGLLVEIDKDACSTLKMNRSDWNIACEDIRSIDFRGKKADIVEGGFPCQAFSYAGKKLGFADIRGTMFFEFARCIKEVHPKIVMGENVKWLLTHDNGRTLSTIVEILDSIGYKVAYKLLRAQYHDVPQKRERLIIMGVRKDITTSIFFPKEQDYTISLREALSGCPDSMGARYPKWKEEILRLVPPGWYWKDLPVDLQKEYMGASYYMGGGKTGMARRLSWDEPSLTLTCSPAQKQTERCHPDHTRPLTIREYARLQTFPDDWNFQWSTASQYKQIGNAVPVNLAFQLGRCIAGMLGEKIDMSSIEMI